MNMRDLPPADQDKYAELQAQFAAHMDHLDAVYQRDTRPCLEGKPSIKTEPEVELTPAGFNYLLPGVEPIRDTPPTSGQARLF